MGLRPPRSPALQFRPARQVGEGSAPLRIRYRGQYPQNTDSGLRWPAAPREKAEGQLARTPRPTPLRGGALEIGCSLNLGQALEIHRRREGRRWLPPSTEIQTEALSDTRRLAILKAICTIPGTAQ